MRFDGLPALALILGCVLGAGVLLVMSVWAWPRTDSGSDRQRRQGRAACVASAKRSQKATVAGVSVLLGLMAGAITFAVSGVIGLAVVFALASAGAPTLVLRRQVNKERLAMRTLWPDAVDSLVSALRAGASLPTAISSLTALSPRLVTDAAAEFERQYRLSGNFDACLDVMKATWADPASDRILETLRLARHVGGSEVTTILRTLGGYLRQESAIRQEVEARQGWIRTAARIGVAAPWIVLALLSTRPEAAAAYNSPSGIAMILIGLGLSVVAYRIMLAVGVLPQPQRWFA
ncbi:MAG: type II secretion system F family protein [Actinomycetales bacterium]|nr:type II secretion system F family protein [Actinomycetales bacterium]